MEILLRHIETLLVDIQSDKVTIRSKALDSLQQMFENRSDEVVNVLASNQGVSWNGLFLCLHQSVKAQAARLNEDRCTAATKNRTGDYSNTLTKCIYLANSHTQNITYDAIFDTAFEVFGDVSLRKHFDLCYLQIIRKQILNSCRCLATVKIHQWSRKCCELHFHSFYICQNRNFCFLIEGLLSYLCQLFEISDMPKMILLECIPLLVQCGTRYTHLVSDLHQYTPNIVAIVHREHQIKAQHQVVLTVYEFTCNVRFENG